MSTEIDGMIECLEPENFFKSFTEHEFIIWAELGNNLELLNLLAILEGKEMYEYCAIIRDILNKRYDAIGNCCS